MANLFLFPRTLIQIRSPGQVETTQDPTGGIIYQAATAKLYSTSPNTPNSGTVEFRNPNLTQVLTFAMTCGAVGLSSAGFTASTSVWLSLPRPATPRPPRRKLACSPVFTTANYETMVWRMREPLSARGTTRAHLFGSDQLQNARGRYVTSRIGIVL